MFMLSLWGVFWNPQDKQNPKLPLELNFEQDFIEKNGKTSATTEMISTVFSTPSQMTFFNDPMTNCQ